MLARAGQHGRLFSPRRFRAEGWSLVRAHPFDPGKNHGFIDSQKMGMEVFQHLDPRAPLIVAEAVWQYSHHVLPGLFTHRGPILTVANWSGTWPGLVGMLNLNGSMTKAGIAYSSLWSEDFSDGFFQKGLRQWLNAGLLAHDQSHVRDLARVSLPGADEQAWPRLCPAIQGAQSHHGRFRRRLHGHVQRDHSR